MTDPNSYICLRSLADYVAKTNHYRQTDAEHCAIAHGFRMIGFNRTPMHATCRFAELTGVPMDVSSAIWQGLFSETPNDATKEEAATFLRLVADHYQPQAAVMVAPVDFTAAVAGIIADALKTQAAKIAETEEA